MLEASLRNENVTNNKKIRNRPRYYIQEMEFFKRTEDLYNYLKSTILAPLSEVILDLLDNPTCSQLSTDYDHLV